MCDDRKLEEVGVVRHVVGIHFGWIPLTILGTPQCTTGTYQLVLRNDATAAISISSMEGLLRRVRHIELRAKYTVKVPQSILSRSLYRSHVLTTFLGPVLGAMMKQVCWHSPCHCFLMLALLRPSRRTRQNRSRQQSAASGC